MLFAALSAFLLLAAPGPGVPRQLELDPGAQKIVELPGVKRVAVGDPAIADVKPLDGRQVLVVGKAEGSTTLLIWAGPGDALTRIDLHVSKQTGEALAQALHQLLPADDLRVSVLNGKRVVQGEVLSVPDLHRLQTLVAGDADVVLLVKLDRTASHHLVAQINAELQKAGLHNAKAELVGSDIFLEGSVEDAADSHKAELIAQSIVGASVPHLP